MARQIRRQAPAERRNGTANVPKRFPLISDYDAENGISLVPGEPGKFTPYLTSIKSLGNVMHEMEGRTDHRASIPDVYAQLQAVRSTVKEYYTDVGMEQYDAITQWRGAVALLLLYPYLFLKKDMPEWVSNPIMPDHIPAEKSLFLHFWRSCVGNERNTQFTALCVRKKKDCYPLLMAHKDCLAIPVAYGVESNCCTLPWLEKRASMDDSLCTFTDPISQLGMVALKKLYADLRELVDARKCTEVLGAAREYLAAIEKELSERQTQEAYAVETVLLIALLLRNAIPYDLHVVKRNAVSYKSAFLDGSGELDFHDASGILERIRPGENDATYSVILNGQLVAHLDEEHLLWCPTPLAVNGSEAFQNLKAQLQKALTTTQEKDKLLLVLKYQLERLQRSFRVEDAYPYLGMLHDRLCQVAKLMSDVSVEWKPISRKDGEVVFKEEAFKPFRLISPAHGDPQTLFADNALGITCMNMDPNHPAEYGSTHSADGAGMIVPPPLGVFGAKVRYAAEPNNVKVYTHATENEVKVTLEIKDDLLKYLAQKSYREESGFLRMPKFSIPMPSVAVWPDVDDSVRKQWKVYYTFVVFHYSEESESMDADVYDVDGNRVGNEKKTSHGEANEEMHRRWQTFDVGNKPAFVALKYKGKTAGVIPLSQELTQEFGSEEHLGILSVDFGTTSTIGMLRPVEDMRCQEICIEPGRLKWILNSTDGDPIADSVFISGALGLHQTPINTVFSLFQLFDKRQDGLPDRAADVTELHLDGNLYYVAENTELVANRDRVLARIKTRLHEKNVESYAAAYLKQVLQFYFLKCRIEHYTSIAFRYAYPLAFSGDEQIRLKRIFEETAKTVATQTGIKLTAVQSCSESMAVAAFFKKESALNPLNARRGIMVLDIGGGTSDFSFWVQNPLADENVINQSVCYSCRIAGIEMLSVYLADQLKKPKGLAWLIDDLKEENATARDPFVEKWLAQLQQLSMTTSNLLDAVTLYTDQFMKQKQEFLQAVFAQQKCKRLREAITLDMALLFWLANLIYVGKMRGTNETGETASGLLLCLAGNGSRIYRALPQETQEQLLSVAAEAGIAIFQPGKRTGWEKTEVVKGLAWLSNAEFKAEEESARHLDITSTQSVCDDFHAFMKKYIETFPEEKPALKMKETLEDERKSSRFFHDFEDAAKTIPKLNARLLAIARDLNGINP